MKTSVLLFSALLLGASSTAQEVKWAREYFHVDNETQSTQIAVSPQKNIAVAGFFHSLDDKRQGSWLCTLDGNGNILWGDTIRQKKKTYPQAEATAVEYSKDGHLYFAVSYSDSIILDGITYAGGTNSSLLIKYGTAGNKLWIQNLPNTTINSIHNDALNNTFLLLTVSANLAAFNTTINVNGGPDVLFAKLARVISRCS